MRVITGIVCLMAVAVTGCAQGFNRAEMRSTLSEQRVFTDWDVERIERLKPQLTFPIRIAVAPTMDGREWTAAEHDIIGAWAKPWKESGLVSDVVVIPEMMVQHGNADRWWKNVRMAAARCGADATLVINSATELDDYVNPLSILNLTIAGMWIAPGHHRDALTLLEAVLIDNRNEFLYDTFVAEGAASRIRPFMYAEFTEVRKESRAAALEGLGARIIEDLPALKGFAAPQGIPGGTPYPTSPK